MKYSVIAIALLLLAVPSMAFWSTGHMIIARIAMDELKNKDPALFNKIQNEIDILTDFSMERDHSFVESAVWADDNKAIQWSAFNEWHFVDTPVIAPDFTGETEIENMNATWAIHEMYKTLNHKKPKFDSGLALSFAWRYMIHLVGDIHQPLHASSLYSAKFPNGDRGGNSFKINYPDNKEIKNLHALWDACVDQYGSIWAPASAEEWDNLGKFAANITAQFPRDKVAQRVRELDERKWATEMNQIAKDVVYDGIEPNSTPSAEYIARGRQVVNEQLAVGGYRLADTMLGLKASLDARSIVKELLAQ